MGAYNTFVSGNVLTAAQLNQIQAEALASYTATTTGMTEGNGTKTAYAVKLGQLCFFRFRFVFGSTSAMSTGNPTITLPYTGIASRTPLGHVHVNFYDASATTYTMGFGIFSTTTLTLYRTAAGGSYVDSAALSSTVPFTWTTSDEIQVAGWYELA